MDAINTCSIDDDLVRFFWQISSQPFYYIDDKFKTILLYWWFRFSACATQRPKGGYCITTTHDFSQENFCSIQGNLWKVLLSIALSFWMPPCYFSSSILPLSGMFNYLHFSVNCVVLHFWGPPSWALRLIPAVSRMLPNMQPVATCFATGTSKTI